MSTRVPSKYRPDRNVVRGRTGRAQGRARLDDSQRSRDLLGHSAPGTDSKKVKGRPSGKGAPATAQPPQEAKGPSGRATVTASEDSAAPRPKITMGVHDLTT